MQDHQMNLQGAKDRPDLNQVWANVQAKLAGEAPVHKKYSHTLTSIFPVMGKKIFGSDHPAPASKAAPESKPVPT